MAAGKTPQVLFLWLFLAVAAGLAFSQSAYFSVREVELSGALQMSRDEVLAVAGVRLPANVFSLNPAAIKAKLAEYPMVAKVRVERRLPARLRIMLTERRPVGALPYGEHLLLFDREGVPYAVRQASRSPRLPLVTGLRPFPVRLGRPERGEGLRWLAAVLGSLPPDLDRRIARVEVRRGFDLSLVLDDGVRVRLGGREAIGRKLGLVRSILAETAAKGWKVREIDVRSVDQPLVRKGAAPAATAGEAGR
ncbi:MAG: cell division protein FtsQ/DivIB [Chitinophagales bacterium]